MPIYLRAAALVIFCSCGSNCALAQTIQYPTYATEYLQAGDAVVRGQDEGGLESYEGSIGSETELLIESELKPHDFQPEPVWQQSRWYSSVEVAAMNRSNSMFGLDERWGEITASPRFTLGWEHETGVGVRGEVWHFRNEENANVYGYAPNGRPVLMGTQPIEDTATTLELDLYRRLEWGKDEFTLGTGLKSASHSFDVAPAFFLSSTSRLQGTGVSVFANGRKSFYSTDDYDVAFIAEGRASVLWGDSEFSSQYGSNDSYEKFGIYEASVGAEWRHQMKRSVMYIRAQYETQLWDLHGSNALGFTGTSASLGITW